MEFKVKFIAAKNPIAESIGNFGLDIVDSIRQDINEPNISIDDIHISGSSCRIGLIVDLFESKARECGVFAGTDFHEVFVPRGFFTKFKKWIIKPLYDDPMTFLGIKLVKPKLKYVEVFDLIDNLDVINAWIKDGCPEYWGTTKEEYESMRSKHD